MSVHEQTIPFSSINVFVGKTDSGKSVVQRAIDAVRSNKYPADTYARHGCKEYKIQILTDRGAVSLCKGKTTTYTVAYFDENGNKRIEEFNAIGRDIPEKVKFILNMNPLKLSDDAELEVLYQPQHKPFFLISEDKGTFSRVISLISSSDKLNKLEKDVNSDILITKRKITQSEEIILDYNTSLDLEKDLLKNLEPYSNIESDSNLVIDEISSIALQIESLNTICSLINQVSKYEDVKHCSLAKDNISDSLSTITAISDIRRNLSIVSKEIPENLQKSETLEVFSKLKEAFKELLDLNINQEQIEKQQIFDFSEFKLLLNSLVSINKSLEELDLEKQSLLEERKEIEGQTCPICGNIIHFEQ